MNRYCETENRGSQLIIHKFYDGRELAMHIRGLKSRNKIKALRFERLLFLYFGKRSDSSAADQSQEDCHNRQNQKYMDQSSGTVYEKSEDPSNNQNHCDQIQQRVHSFEV